jgi:hypothetical protein
MREGLFPLDPVISIGDMPVTPASLLDVSSAKFDDDYKVGGFSFLRNISRMIQIQGVVIHILFFPEVTFIFSQFLILIIFSLINKGRRSK